MPGFRSLRSTWNETWGNLFGTPTFEYTNVWFQKARPRDIRSVLQDLWYQPDTYPIDNVNDLHEALCAILDRSFVPPPHVADIRDAWNQTWSNRFGPLPMAIIIRWSRAQAGFGLPPGDDIIRSLLYRLWINRDSCEWTRDQVVHRILRDIENISDCQREDERYSERHHEGSLEDEFFGRSHA